MNTVEDHIEPNWPSLPTDNWQWLNERGYFPLKILGRTLRWGGWGFEGEPQWNSSKLQTSEISWCMKPEWLVWRPDVSLLLLSRPTGELYLVHLYYIDQSTLRNSWFTDNHNGFFINWYRFLSGFSLINHLDKRSETLLSAPNICMTCNSIS